MLPWEFWQKCKELREPGSHCNRLCILLFTRIHLRHVHGLLLGPGHPGETTLFWRFFGSLNLFWVSPSLFEGFHQHPAKCPLHLEDGLLEMLLEEDVAKAQKPATKRFDDHLARRERNCCQSRGCTENLVPVQQAAVNSSAVCQSARSHGSPSTVTLQIHGSFTISTLHLLKSTQQGQHQTPMGFGHLTIPDAEETNRIDHRDLHSLRERWK
mmetsp:Transcript_11064/g.24261  ORF Transcript_11064/g.24261 Transcript_11064/m.24261 type:complete len:212 (+) Transcript_11064:755-1390(+)